MNLQQISQLLNIDFSEMKLQSGFNKLSKNQYYIITDCFIVKLSNNDKWMIVCNHQQVIILLQKHIWHSHIQGYAGTNIGGSIKLFHQMYIRYAQGLVVDHVNHLKTDNRFDNLRVCTYKQNSRNLKKRSETLTTGVCVQMCGTINYVVSFINSNEKQIKKYYNVDKLGMEQCMSLAINQRKIWEQQYHYCSSSS